MVVVPQHALREHVREIPIDIVQQRAYSDNRVGKNSWHIRAGDVWQQCTRLFFCIHCIQHVHVCHFIGNTVYNELYDVRFVFCVFGCTDQRIACIRLRVFRREFVDADGIPDDFTGFQRHRRIHRKPPVQPVPQPFRAQDHLVARVCHAHHGIAVFVRPADFLRICDRARDDFLACLACRPVWHTVVHVRHTHIRLRCQYLVGIVAHGKAHAAPRFNLPRRLREILLRVCGDDELALALYVVEIPAISDT